MTQFSSSACRTHSATLRYSLPVFSLGCCGAPRSIQGQESNPRPQDQTPSTSDSARKFPGFDAYRRTIRTATLKAQSWFDPDWQMFCSFNRVESVRWFEQAALVAKAIPLLEEAYRALIAARCPQPKPERTRTGAALAAEQTLGMLPKFAIDRCDIACTYYLAAQLA